MDHARARKLSDRILRIVAEMLERRVKDPRLGFVTVTEARLTGDLREATVFYTVYGSEQERAETAAALASATGLIRTEVGRQTGLRHTPSVTFVPDMVPEGARHMEDLVARAREADAKLAEVRKGAVPAGDPDPYREPARAEADEAADEVADGPADEVHDEPDHHGHDDGMSGSRGTRSDLLGGTSGGGDHGAGYSPG
jgi:ribosome-binding factor A